MRVIRNISSPHDSNSFVVLFLPEGLVDVFSFLQILSRLFFYVPRSSLNYPVSDEMSVDLWPSLYQNLSRFLCLRLYQLHQLELSFLQVVFLVW